jgi:hypothetical protein
VNKLLEYEMIKNKKEELANYLKITYDEKGNILKTSIPVKISEGHWVNIKESKENTFEFEHTRTAENFESKNGDEILKEDLEFNSQYILKNKNKRVHGKIILP